MATEGATILRVDGEESDVPRSGAEAVLQPQCSVRKTSIRLTAQALRAEARAAKWGHVWLRKVFPDGTQWQRANDLEGKCPVRKVFLHGDQDFNQVLGPCDLLQLAPGSPLLPPTLVPTTRNPVFQPPLHPAFPKDCWYLPAQVQHWSNNLDDFMTISFSRPTRVFILLPSMAQEPRWLRSLFFKLRDPNLQEVHLKMKWRTMLATRLMLGMCGLLEHWRRQTIRVFKSKKVYHPGEQLVIGGLGLATIVEIGYAVAFHQEYSEFRNHPGDEGPLHSGPQHSNPGFHFGLRELVDLETWMQRLIKVVKRGRLVEARLLIETDLARPRDQSLLMQHDINVLPEGEDQVLLVDLAAASRDIKMVCLLVDRCNCVLSFKALQLIVHQWEEVPALSGTALGLLIKYLLKHPNPLAITSAYLMAIRAEIRQRFRVRPTAQLEEALLKLQQLQLRLLRKSQDVVRDSQAEHHQKVLQLEAILDPKYHLAPASHASASASGSSSAHGPHQTAVMTISCFKPLRVAMRDEDAGFMDSPVVEQFNRLIWQGREYVLETCKDGQHSLSLLDPSLMATVFVNCGLASPQMTVLEQSARLWHLATYSQQAFYNSPRARWILRCLSSIAFIILYLQVVGADLIPSWFSLNADSSLYNSPTPEVIRAATINIALFNCWILGNVVEVLQILFLRYNRNPLAWASNHSLDLFFLLVDLLLITVAILFALYINRLIEVDLYTATWLLMCWAIAAPLLWGQALLPLIPLLDNLGPMLGTLRSMFRQVATFVIPWSLITAGFAVSLNVVYSSLGITELSSFWTTALFLFKGFANGGPDYDVLDDALDELEGVLDSKTLQAYRLYGTFVFIAYTVVSTIILGNLLIAIITNSYRPDNVRAQSKLSFASYVDMHQFQVEHHLLCSPFNLVPLLFWFLPSGQRLKVHPTWFYRIALAFLDGFVPASPDNTTLPVGRTEIPHLIYLFIIPPLAALASFTLFAIHIPISSIYFAAVGHARVVKAVRSLTSSFNNGSAGSNDLRKALVASSAGEAALSGTSLSRRGSQGGAATGNFSRSSGSVVASNDEYGIFGQQEDETKAAEKSVLERLWEPLVRIASFCLWLAMGFIMLVTCFLCLFVYTIYVMLAAVAWSLYHIVWGSFRLWAHNCRRMVGGSSKNTVIPDTSIASRRAKQNFEEQQVQRANMVKDMEERYKHFSLFTTHDVRDCLQEVFGDAYGLGVTADGAHADPGRAAASQRAKMGFREAGVVSIATHMLNSASLPARSKSAVGVASHLVAIARTFEKSTPGNTEATPAGAGRVTPLNTEVDNGGHKVQPAAGGTGNQGLASRELSSLHDVLSSLQDQHGSSQQRGQSHAAERPVSAAASAEGRRVGWHGSSTGDDAVESMQAQPTPVQCAPVQPVQPASAQAEVLELKQAVLELNAKVQEMSGLLAALVGTQRAASSQPSMRTPAAVQDDL